jgi:hypothetical protein
MNPAKLSPDERAKVLSHFLRKYLQRGYQLISYSPTTAELHRPSRFPHWLFPEKTRFVDIDESGLIYIRSR